MVKIIIIASSLNESTVLAVSVGRLPRHCCLLAPAYRRLLAQLVTSSCYNPLPPQPDPREGERVREIRRDLRGERDSEGDEGTTLEAGGQAMVLRVGRCAATASSCSCQGIGPRWCCPVVPSLDQRGHTVPRGRACAWPRRRRQPTTTVSIREGD